MQGATESAPRAVGAHAGQVVHVDLVIAQICARQNGVITLEQLVTAGLAPEAVRARVRRGRLHRVRRGVFSLSPSLTPFAAEMAAVLACGEGAVTSHRTAAALFGLLPNKPPIHTTLPTRNGRGGKDLKIHRPKTAPPATKRHGVPTTTIARTIQDLAATENLNDLDRAITEARVRRLIDDRGLRSLAESSAARPGAANLRKALHGQERGFTRSKAERKLKQLIHDAGLPAPDTNRTIAGRERDAVWSKQRLIVEIDGYAAHGTRRAFEGDRRRDAELQAEGWRTMRVTWRQLTQEQVAVASRLSRALYSAAP